MSQKKLIIALDFTDLEQVKKIIEHISPEHSMVKVGLQLYVNEGKKILDYLTERGFEIFLDLKLHDIPNTINRTIKEISNFNVAMTTIHLHGGKDMIEAALESSSETKIIGVTILTSLNNSDINQIHGTNFDDQFTRIIELAENTKIDGIVCSPQELTLVKELNKIKVVPGIRNELVNDDQKRTMSSVEAYKNGADFIVVGRPITEAKNIEEAILNYIEE
tara:strand:+ start:836 stop:1495 length:660 start_codon:yes stop_codon:yes gene_type:complete